MTAFAYSDIFSQVVNLVPSNATDPALLGIFPAAISDAEQRCYRELQLLNTVVRDQSGALTAGQRTLQLPSTQGTFLAVDDLNVITPVGTLPEQGTRNPLAPASREVLDFLWPSVAGSAVPNYFARISDSTAVVGPWPDQSYQIEVVGTVRPPPLSASNTTTLLTTYFPDLFLAAMMVFISGWMKNYGAAVDDPQQGVTWEQHYGKLFASAATEEALKKYRSEGWGPEQPSPLATPPRT